MEIVSIMIFFIYVVAILMILIYISPIFAPLVLILVPVVSVVLFPDQTIGFFEKSQFSFGGIYIQNLHILLLIWSAIIASVASIEMISWYLLGSEKPKLKTKEPQTPSTAQAPVTPAPIELQKPLKVKVETALLELGKIMTGRKSY